MGLLDFFFGSKNTSDKEKMTLEELNEINQAYIAESEPENSEDALFRAASSAMTSQNFEESIKLYKQLADNYPAKKGSYLSQVGAAYFFLGDYRKAIVYYVLARENGANDKMMDDNIWEASQVLYKKEKDIAAVEKYLEYYPNGSYAKKAKKILSS